MTIIEEAQQEALKELSVALVCNAHRQLSYVFRGDVAAVRKTAELSTEAAGEINRIMRQMTRAAAKPVPEQGR